MTKVKMNSERFKTFLAERNISQNRLAQKAGITSAFMSQILSGARNPSSKTRMKILEAINAGQRFRGEKEYEFSDIFRVSK